MKKIAILGAGLTGCMYAYKLRKLGYDITIFEKLGVIGGLCRTDYLQNIPYEPFGPHIFHTNKKNVIEFLYNLGIKFNNYQHRIGVKIKNDDEIYEWPITLRTIKKLLKKINKKKLINEIMAALFIEKNKKYDNFEDRVIDMMGKTLYKIFVKDYTKKQWHIDPKKMLSTWVSKRIEFRMNNDNRLFSDQFQGMPINGYNELFNVLIKDCKVITNFPIRSYKEIDSNKYDVIISTIPIDLLCEYKFGKLDWIGTSFSIIVNDIIKWPYPYGVINYMNEPEILRITNYNIMYEILNKPYILGYEIPNLNVINYPIYTKNSIKKYNQYVKYVLSNHRMSKFFLAGRLGTYKYINMDDAINAVLNAYLLVSVWNDIGIDTKYDYLKI